MLMGGGSSCCFCLNGMRLLTINPATARLIPATTNLSGQSFDYAHNNVRNGVVELRGSGRLSLRSRRCA